MNRLPNATQRIVTALIAGVVAVPLSSTALFLDTQMKRSAMDEQAAEADRMQERAEQRAAERLYFRAVEEFQRGTSVKDAVTKPSAPQAGSEGAGAVSSLTTEDLGDTERSLLRKYVRARSCPESLKLSPVQGFYELCLAIVGSGAAGALPGGLLNHTAYIKRTLHHLSAPDLSPFKLRMQMLQEAVNGEKRDAGQLPGRPVK